MYAIILSTGVGIKMKNFSMNLLWAKSSPKKTLIGHLIDSACVANALLNEYCCDFIKKLSKKYEINSHLIKDF